MWIHFMDEALTGQPEHTLPRPTGIVDLRINPETGLIASDSNVDAIWEKFLVGELPDREPDTPFTLASSQEPEELAEADEPIF